jgi:predicted nucleotidyltransferase
MSTPMKTKIRKNAVCGCRLKNEGSDIDIVVLSEDFRNKDIFERALLIKDAEVLTIKKFIITMTPEEFESGSSLVGLYASEGKVGYG